MGDACSSIQPVCTACTYWVPEKRYYDVSETQQVETTHTHEHEHPGHDHLDSGYTSLIKQHCVESHANSSGCLFSHGGFVIAENDGKDISQLIENHENTGHTHIHEHNHITEIPQATEVIIPGHESTKWKGECEFLSPEERYEIKQNAQQCLPDAYPDVITERGDGVSYDTPVTKQPLAIAPTLKIPSYVKDVATFWHQGQIDDDSFVGTIDYMIETKIITIPDLDKTQKTAPATKAVPDWVKTTTKFWTDGVTSDREYADTIQWLVKEGIISIETKKPDYFEGKQLDESEFEQEQDYAGTSSPSDFVTRGTSPTDDNLVTVTVNDPFVSRTTQKNFLTWLNNWDKMSSLSTIPTDLKNSSLDLYDPSGNFISVRYDEIIPVEYTIPSVDASGKDSLVESFSFKTSNKNLASDISARTIPDKYSNSALQVGDFRVELGSLPTTHVFKVETGAMKVSESGVITFEKWELNNSMQDYAPYSDWVNDWLIAGNTGAPQELPITLSYVAPNLQDIVREIHCSKATPNKLGFAKLDANKEQIAMFTLILIVEDCTFS